MQTAVKTAATSISDLNRRVTKNRWISTKSVALMDSHKLIPSGSKHDEERKQIRSKLTKSVRNSREKWQATKVKEMEKAAAVSNIIQLFRLVKEAGIINSSVRQSRKVTTLLSAYGKLESDFATSSGVRQGCPLCPFLFNFTIDLLM
ncbi:unnamed protein product [Schistosoma rodhaini]|uniref:Reverse transcriptase domain-containing protein n=1 Tax=Schistosoma rodhaini TaxID=6188 RepID=A0AA85FTF9_9TREM|nr:unnamed protein product [Schistosoma rodhaini]